MPGGTLEVEIEEDGTVLMTGDVGYVGKHEVRKQFHRTAEGGKMKNFKKLA